MKDEDFDAPDALPELVDTSDDEGPPRGQPPTDNLADADELSEKAEVPPTRTDTMGLGLETFDGRGPSGVVRVREGSTMPPELTPEMWRLSTARQKRKLLTAT